MTALDFRTGQDHNDAHQPRAGSEPTLPASQIDNDAHIRPAGGDHSSDHSQRRFDAQRAPAVVGSHFPASHVRTDAHVTGAGGDPTWSGSEATTNCAIPKACPSLADPFLALAAAVLDDAERTRIANENRLRQLTRSEVDSDGIEAGFGLDESHPDVARLSEIVALLAKVEHGATLNLNRMMRRHPLGPWVKAQRGVGEKQGARLLASLGDPYWNTLHDRPRTVSELWAYCGLHVLPVSQIRFDTHLRAAGGDSTSAGGDLSHSLRDAQSATAGVAVRRTKGQRANWSAAGKSRAYLVAESMLRAGNRDLYDARKEATVGRMHVAPCVRCGPAGKPAQPGTPWSDGHRHADALRIVSKTLLKGLWLEARRIHDDEPADVA